MKIIIFNDFYQIFSTCKREKQLLYLRAIDLHYSGAEWRPLIHQVYDWYEEKKGELQPNKTTNEILKPIHLWNYESSINKALQNSVETRNLSIFKQFNEALDGYLDENVEYILPQGDGYHFDTYNLIRMLKNLIRICELNVKNELTQALLDKHFLQFLLGFTLYKFHKHLRYARKKGFSARQFYEAAPVFLSDIEIKTNEVEKGKTIDDCLEKIFADKNIKLLKGVTLKQLYRQLFLIKEQTDRTMKFQFKTKA